METLAETLHIYNIFGSVEPSASIANSAGILYKAHAAIYIIIIVSGLIVVFACMHAYYATLMTVIRTVS